MKRVYWRSSRASRGALALIAVVSALVMLAVEKLPVQAKQDFYAEKMLAAQKAHEAMGVLKTERLRRGIAIDPELDPAGTGMIGSALTPVTSNMGYLDAKRASVNPNFAAVLVDWLTRAGIEKGDLVALGLSGSFPALNVATFAAVSALEATPIVISGTSSSQWGANDPNFLWVDMEATLVEKKVFPFRSVAASRGGIDDVGLGMTKEGRAMLEAAIARNDIRLIDSKSLDESIAERMQIYEAHAQNRPIKAYVNIGGSTASVGTRAGKKQFEPGLTREAPGRAGMIDSVMARFAERGVPVIHVVRIEELALRHGIALDPARISRIGESNVFVRAEYNRWLAGAGIALILLMMAAFLRLQIGLQILRVRRQRASLRPEQMV